MHLHGPHVLAVVAAGIEAGAARPSGEVVLVAFAALDAAVDLATVAGSHLEPLASIGGDDDGALGALMWDGSIRVCIGWQLALSGC